MCCRQVEFAFSTLTGNAGGVSFECKLVPGGQSDSEAFRPCTSPATYNDLADGAWQFFVRAQGEGIADSSAFVKVGDQVPDRSCREAGLGQGSAIYVVYGSMEPVQWNLAMCAVHAGLATCCGMQGRTFTYARHTLDAISHAKTCPLPPTHATSRSHTPWCWQDTTAPVLAFSGAPSSTPSPAPTADFEFNATDASLVGYQCVLQWSTAPAGTLPQLNALQPEGLQYNVVLTSGENATCTSPLTLYWLQPGGPNCLGQHPPLKMHGSASKLSARPCNLHAVREQQITLVPCGCIPAAV